MAEVNGDPLAVEPIVSKDIEVIARRELAVRAVDAIAEVLEVDVSVGNLLILARDPNPSIARLAAKRALRCVEAIGRPNSRVVRAIGETGIYHYVEGVVEYGADEQTFLGLMQDYGLAVEEVTGLYAVRRLVEDYTTPGWLGFPMLINALKSVGINPSQAGRDPEEAVAAMDEAGYFVDHAGGVTFDRPHFLPGYRGHVPFRANIDSLRSERSREALTWVREHFHDLAEAAEIDETDGVEAE